MKKSRTASLTGLTAALLAMSACGTGDPAGGDADGSSDTQTVRLASYVQDNTALGQAVQSWADETTVCSDGRLEFEPFFAGSLFDASEIRDATQAGRVEVGHFAPGYHPGEFPLTDGLLAVPFIATSVPALMDSFMELYETKQEAQAEWHDQGLHLMNVLPGSPSALGINTEINTLEDLQGLQIRGFSGGGLNAGLQAVDAMPIDLELTQLPEGMQRGVIDGFTGLTIDGITSLSLEENTPYLYDTGFGISGTIAISVNKDWWDSLSEDIQQCATDAASGLTDTYLEFVDAVEVDVCDTFDQAGVEMSRLDEKEQERWRELIGEEQQDVWAEVASGSVSDPGSYFADYEQIMESAESEYADIIQPGLTRCID